jgi:hypothetical protein
MEVLGSRVWNSGRIKGSSNMISVKSAFYNWIEERFVDYFIEKEVRGTCGLVLILTTKNGNI